ncbi:MAG: acetyl-CoA hydrolase/transferase C-terminal domain-containing protein [Promethearchaeota archaeon]
MNWREKFKDKEISAEKAIGFIKPGMRIFIHSACSEPQMLMDELIKRHRYLKDIEIVHFFTVRRDLPLKNKAEDLFRFNTFFIANDSMREAVNEGQADYTPMFLSEIPRAFRLEKKVDVALIQLSPPDANNLCSFGINVDVAKPIAESADMIIAEINPKVPRTVGNSFIPMRKVFYFVYNDTKLLEFNYAKPGKVLKQIGENAASLVRNGATIQVGIGRAPHAVLYALDDHKDLGVHTDVIFNKYIDLIENGVITCEKKTVNSNRIVTNFALGTNKLFKFLNNNLFVEFHPATYTNNPFNIAQNDNMTTINGALSVDLFGQVNSSSLPPREPGMPPFIYQGFGGIVDFSRGAVYAKGGRSIICLPSTAVIDGKKVSRIVPMFPPGTHVSLTMADVHYVVTEYGIAQLRGKSIRERIMALISIAHPDFRQSLLDEAKKFKFIYSDQRLNIDKKTGNIIPYPKKYEKVFYTKDGLEVFFRPVLPTDERMIQELYYSLSDESRVYRFFRPKIYFTRQDKAVQNCIYVDYENIFVLVGLIGSPDDQKIIAISSYERDSDDNLGEISFTVHRDYRDKGLTKFMFEYLGRIAREKGLDGFKGEVLWENKKMLHIIKDSGYIIKSINNPDGWIFSFKFNEKSK